MHKSLINEVSRLSFFEFQYLIQHYLENKYGEELFNELPFQLTDDLQGTFLQIVENLESLKRHGRLKLEEDPDIFIPKS
jgi:RecG-like helicase